MGAEAGDLSSAVNWVAVSVRWVVLRAGAVRDKDGGERVGYGNLT